MKASIFVTFFLLGIGQNLPFAVYWFGLGLGDVCMVGTLVLAGFHPLLRGEFGRAWHRLSVPIIAVGAFVLMAACSLMYNAVGYGFQVRDIFELARVGYLVVLMVFTSAATWRFQAVPLAAFSVGIAVSGLVAYANPHRADVLGTVVIWNPNVMGNMMAVGVVFASMLALFYGRYVLAVCVVGVCLGIAGFTFSKGAWLMCIFGVVAYAAANLGVRRQRFAWLGKTILVALVLTGGLFAYQKREAIGEIIAFKLATSQLSDSAEEGGTVAQRWGFVLSTKMMLQANPVFGVGMSNYEQANRDLIPELKGYYWESDNPHSAWLYLLACMGIPAFVCFALFFTQVFIALTGAVVLRGFYRLIYLASVTTMFVLSGVVMLQLVAGYFFWVFAGVVFARQALARTTRSLPPPDAAEPPPIPSL